ncbi:rho-related BTB domain-containing protein 3 isoform 1-T1 [Anomaloglossus baeobatrachus]|uniref:rho-related BTB domain-containing protein 3 n=1 Tax=Anomaloglossus baeobatrachus TaxID=238106 RepID=UPI003F507F34
MSIIQIVSFGNENSGLYENEGDVNLISYYFGIKSNGLHIEDNGSAFSVYQANILDNVDICVHECQDWGTFASDLQSSLATISEGDIIILKSNVKNKSLFLEIKNNFAPLLKQILNQRTVPVMVLAFDVNTEDGPSCTCPICTSAGEQCVPASELIQLSKDLGGTYLEIRVYHCSYIKAFFGPLLEYFIRQVMNQKSAKRKKKNQDLKVYPPKLQQPEKMPVLNDEPSRYIIDFRKLLDHCQCADVVFCSADLSPISAAHRVVLCSVSSVFRLLFGVISGKDIHDSCSQNIAQTFFSVYQEPAVAAKNSPVRVIVGDHLFQKCLSDILQFIYSGASQWQLLEHHLEEKLKDAEELSHVSRTVQSIINGPGTSSHCQKPLPLWESLGFFFNNTSLADMHFQVQDTKIPAHRAVLVARCEVMAAMLSGSYMEANCILIPVKGISKDTFLAFLEYIYTDNCCPASVLQTMSLLICSEMYQVSRLQRMCECNITIQLQSVPSRELASTSLNVVRLLKKAKFYNSESLYTWLLYFVATHYMIFNQKQEFQDLSAEELDFVEKHKWPSHSYLTKLEDYRSYIHLPKHRCAIM